MNTEQIVAAATLRQKVKVDAMLLVSCLSKAKDIAHNSTNIGGDQAARLDILISDVVASIPLQFRVMVDAPDYLIGTGPDNEFVVTARTLSKERAEQIASLLNG